MIALATLRCQPSYCPGSPRRSSVPGSPERARAVAKSLLGGIHAERVLILDTVRSQNYRGKLPVDETVVSKLETIEERRADQPLVRGVDYLPSGSVMDGLAAAILAECQMRRTKGTLVATWPANGRSTVVPIVASLLLDLSFDVARFDGNDEFNAGYSVSPRYESDLYT